MIRLSLCPVGLLLRRLLSLLGSLRLREVRKLLLKCWQCRVDSTSALPVNNRPIVWCDLSRTSRSLQVACVWILPGVWSEWSRFGDGGFGLVVDKYCLARDPFGSRPSFGLCCFVQRDLGFN